MKTLITGKSGVKKRKEFPPLNLQEELIASEVRYRRLFESAKDGILILGAETGKIIDVNPFLVELLGFPKNEFVGKEIWQIGFFKDVAANKEKFLELKQQKYVRYENLPLETIDGRKINVEFVSNVYLENHRKIIQCNIRDITERKKRENELIDSEIRRHALLQTIPDLIWSKNTDGKYLTCNSTFESFFGAIEADIIGKTDYDFIDRELADSFRENDKKAMEAGKSTTNEEWITFAGDGHRAFLETIKAPMYDADNKLIGVLGIGRDITKRKETENALIKAKEKAEESDRLKTAFLANMSHEIRTPMNGIIGFTELLKEPMLTGEEQKTYIDIIEKSGERLLNIINDIISISKIESGETGISVSPTNINEVIENLISFFSSEAEQKNIKIQFLHFLSGSEAIINTDKEKVTSILTNLIKNAIKFTATGSIEIGYVKKKNYLEFFVKDTGTGVPEEQKEIIFERFRQGSESLIRNYEGAGLGLSISKGYVDFLGGKIWVENNKENPLTGKLNSENGSTFYFTIPYESVNEEKTTLKKIPAYNVKERTLKNLKILIVEDDRISEFLISIISKKISNNILKVANGIDAIQVFQDNPDIDLVLMDIKMPGMDGYEATRQIRKFNKNVIIIAQTAYALEGDGEKAAEAGCNDYISKPINLIKLKEMIVKHLKISKTALIEEFK
jgi:PAS domain S-box-containing protein